MAHCGQPKAQCEVLCSTHERLQRACPKVDLMQTKFLSENLIADFDPVVVILSPPRCGSTVLARSFWQHRAFRWYLHEPCDRAYHIGLGPQQEPAIEMLIDRIGLFHHSQKGTGRVIKETTFQAGDVIEKFQVATMPVIFLIRD